MSIKRGGIVAGAVLAGSLAFGQDASAQDADAGVQDVVAPAEGSAEEGSGAEAPTVINGTQPDQVVNSGNGDVAEAIAAVVEEEGDETEVEGEATPVPTSIEDLSPELQAFIRENNAQVIFGVDFTDYEFAQDANSVAILNTPPVAGFYIATNPLLETGSRVVSNTLEDGQKGNLLLRAEDTSTMGRIRVWARDAGIQYEYTGNKMLVVNIGINGGFLVEYLYELKRPNTDEAVGFASGVHLLIVNANEDEEEEEQEEEDEDEANNDSDRTPSPTNAVRTSRPNRRAVPEPQQPAAVDADANPSEGSIGATPEPVNAPQAEQGTVAAMIEDIHDENADPIPQIDPNIDVEELELLGYYREHFLSLNRIALEKIMHVITLTDGLINEAPSFDISPVLGTEAEQSAVPILRNVKDLLEIHAANLAGNSGRPIDSAEQLVNLYLDLQTRLQEVNRRLDQYDDINYLAASADSIQSALATYTSVLDRLEAASAIALRQLQQSNLASAVVVALQDADDNLVAFRSRIDQVEDEYIKQRLNRDLDNALTVLRNDLDLETARTAERLIQRNLEAYDQYEELIDTLSDLSGHNLDDEREVLLTHLQAGNLGGFNRQYGVITEKLAEQRYNTQASQQLQNEISIELYTEFYIPTLPTRFMSIANNFIGQAIQHNSNGQHSEANDEIKLVRRLTELHEFIQMANRRISTESGTANDANRRFNDISEALANLLELPDNQITIAAIRKCKRAVSNALINLGGAISREQAYYEIPSVLRTYEGVRESITYRGEPNSDDTVIPGEETN